MNRVPAAFLVLTIAVPALAQSPEAMKSAALETSIRAAVDGIPQAAPQAAAPIAIAQVRSYSLGGFTFESDAQNASKAAQINLRNAGLKVLRSESTRQRAGAWNYGFRIEYFEANEPSAPARSVSNSGGGDYAFESDAKNALSAEENLLRGRGYAIVLGNTLKRSAWPYHYYYQVAYTPNGAPAAAGLYTSGVYNSGWEAQNGLNAYAADFARKGYQVMSERVYRAPGAGWYFFQLRYRRNPLPR